jgi:hypothetical protein
VESTGQRREEVYSWVERTLVQHKYAGLPRPEKGVVRLYIAQMTGLSRAQVTCLISGYQEAGRVTAVPYQRTRFPTTYTAADVALLAYVDGHVLHGMLVPDPRSGLLIDAHCAAALFEGATARFAGFNLPALNHSARLIACTAAEGGSAPMAVIGVIAMQATNSFPARAARRT